MEVSRRQLEAMQRQTDKALDQAERMNELLTRVVKLTEPIERAQRGGEYVAGALKRVIFGEAGPRPVRNPAAPPSGSSAAEDAELAAVDAERAALEAEQAAGLAGTPRRTPRSGEPPPGRSLRPLPPPAVGSEHARVRLLPLRALAHRSELPALPAPAGGELFRLRARQGPGGELMGYAKAASSLGPSPSSAAATAPAASSDCSPRRSRTGSCRGRHDARSRSNPTAPSR